MFLSSIIITPEYIRKHNLVSRSSLKNFVWRLFPLSQNREFLWKMKPSPIDNGISLLILSDIEPCESSLPIRTKKMPVDYFNVSTYGFSIDTVSCRRSRYPDTGKAFHNNLYKEPDIIKWFVEKATRSGFSVSPESIEIRDIAKTPMENRDEFWNVSRVTISGILTVTDPVAFMHTATKGFGRSKGFGFGLMELKKV